MDITTEKYPKKSGNFWEKNTRSQKLKGTSGTSTRITSYNVCYTKLLRFHAGTTATDKGITASGGRVLGVTALGKNVQEAIDRAYAAGAHISWDGVHYRKDIGQKALKRLNQPPQVGIVMGSDSDLPVMEGAAVV